jgi:hypothetical protein
MNYHRMQKYIRYLTRDYYDRDKVSGFGKFRYIFLAPYFSRSLINPPTKLFGFSRGMGPHISIRVLYSQEKTFGTLVVVFLLDLAQIA